MNDLNETKPSGSKAEAEIVDLAKRILKVYGRVKKPVLDAEIKRMAKMLDIPIEEVVPNA